MTIKNEAFHAGQQTLGRVVVAIGSAMVPLPLPNNPALVNLTAYAQWGVADPLGVFMTASGPFALTQGQTLVLR